MPNPFLSGDSGLGGIPDHIEDTYGDSTWYDSSPYHVAAMLLFALMILTIMKVSGFRAMVGIGRG